MRVVGAAQGGADDGQGGERRPDGVLYINSFAIATLELKNSRVSVGAGIRQSLSNQQPEFNAWFYSTVQFVFAGNDSEGLRYGTIGTPEKFFLAWKEDESDNRRFKLDKYLLKLCAKPRLYEACKYFTLFEQTPFKGRCAVVTSYNPQARDVTLEETGAHTETDRQFIYNTYTELLKDIEPAPGKSKTETYEERAKTLFVKALHGILKDRSEVERILLIIHAQNEY